MTSFDEHPFRFLWRGPNPTSDEVAVRMIGELERHVADRIYENEPNPASSASLRRILMPFHENGTFMIGERFNTIRDGEQGSPASRTADAPYGLVRAIPPVPETHRITTMPPPFIRGEKGGFEYWATLTAIQDLKMMAHERVLPGGVTYSQFQCTPAVVAAALQYRDGQGLPLHAKIPNQNYIDYFRRAIALFLFGDADHAFDTEREYNDRARHVAISVIEDYLKEKDKTTLNSIKTLMVYSLLAGVIGLDMKCSHCAASTIQTDNAVFLNGYAADDECTGSTYEWLTRKASDETLFCPELFAWNKYVELVLRRPCKLVFFPDDFAETIFDLYRIQAELSYNEHLSVIMFPRNGRFHNDIAYEDVGSLLGESCFTQLRGFSSKGRFVVSPNGPRNGGVEPAKLSSVAVDVIASEADVVFAKGSRTYELMATGMRVPTFGAQAVAREFSESVLGADAKMGVPALTFFHAFPDFFGFKERHRRVAPLFPTGRSDWQARMTAIDSARFTNGQQFSNLAAKMGREAASEEIMERAKADNVAPHEVLMC
ncbi:MAG: hypothetical protein NTY19_43590 [Planctomycetota bacterium]|nr:hypothetical protein [Planctomycetota bacterium]